MTARLPFLQEAVTIAEWWKNRRGESIRLVLNTFEGRNVVDLRTWYSEDGGLKPGKGFAAEVRHLPRLAAAIAKAEAKAGELGLLPAETESREGSQRLNLLASERHEGAQ
jgi:Transcriptional Coactivator p15 (PC4)